VCTHLLDTLLELNVPENLVRSLFSTVTDLELLLASCLCYSKKFANITCTIQINTVIVNPMVGGVAQIKPIASPTVHPQVEEVGTLALSLEPVFDPTKYEENAQAAGMADEEKPSPPPLYERIGGGAAVKATVSTGRS